MSGRVAFFAAAVTAAAVLLSLAPGDRAGAGAAIQGDMNCDQAVDTHDVLAGLLATGGLETAGCVSENGDVNCSGAVDLDDVIDLLWHTSGAGREAIADCPPIGSPLPTPTSSQTQTASASPGDTPTPTPSPTVTPTATATAGQTPSPTPTLTPTPTATPSPTPSPTPTPTPTPTATPTPAPTLMANNYTMVPVRPDVFLERLTGGVVYPGTSDVLLLQQTGKIWRLSPGTTAAPSVFGDVSGDMMGTPVSDEGLLGIAFEPGSNSVVYLNYTRGYYPVYYDPGGTATPEPSAKHNHVARFNVVGDQLVLAGGGETILDLYQPHWWHNVNALVFGPDEMLYIGVGDGGDSNYSWTGQTLDDLYGSILRIDVSGGGPGYTVPTDNPFYNSPTAAPEVWAYGFRNPWQFSFDSVTGTMWIGDVGQSNWEEVNIGQPGGNYGWDGAEGHGCYYTATPTPNPTPNCMAGKVTPRAVFPHQTNPVNCAVAGGHVYHGQAMPELDGYYVYGDLCSGRIWGVNAGNPNATPVLLTDSDACPTSFIVEGNGELLAVRTWYCGGGPQDPYPPLYRLQRKS